jgi:hypothetical protein
MSEHGIGSRGGIFSGSWVKTVHWPSRPNGRWMLAGPYPLHDAGTIFCCLLLLPSEQRCCRCFAVCSSSGHPNLVEAHAVTQHLKDAPQQHPGHDDPRDILAVFARGSLVSASIPWNLADPLH